MGKQIKVDTEGHRSTVLHRLNGMRETIEGCDFTIKVGSEEIYAHSYFLMAGSDYFGAMLSHNTKEKQTGIAIIKEAEPTCVKKCIEFIYTGISPELEDDIEPLMHVASLMQLSSLCDGIVDFLEDNLDLESFLVTWRIANLYDRTCACFAFVNIAEIVKLDGFVQFDKSYIEKLLGSTFDGIPEENKLHALICWVRFDSEKRVEVMDELLKFIKLSKISASYLRHVVENETSINKNSQRLLKFSLFIMDNVALKSGSFKDCSNMANIAIFDKTSGYLQKFNPIDNSWMQMQKMNEVMIKNEFSAVCVGIYIYVLMRNKSVYRLSYLDESVAWERVGDMFDDHGLSPPTVAFRDCIYVIGGHNKCLTKSVEKYDPLSGMWTELTDKPQASKCSTPVLLNDQIYCCGGYVDGKVTNAVDRFNSNSSVWNSVAPMSEAKGYIAAVAFDGKLYALGGFRNSADLATLECYDPEKDSWTSLKPMNTARSWFQSVLINGEIYAVGGYACSINNIGKYNPDKNEWMDVRIPGNMKMVESVKIKVKR